MPLVYHGSTEMFEHFKPSSTVGDYGPGIYFADNEHDAQVAGKGAGGSYVRSFNIQVENPLIISFNESSDDYISKLLVKAGVTDEDVQDSVHPLIEMFSLLETIHSSAKLIKWLRKIGFDGIFIEQDVIIENGENVKGNYWVVFDQNTIEPYGDWVWVQHSDRLQNPVTSRLDHVIDNNNPFVAHLVVSVLDEALGIHRTYNEFTDMKDDDGDNLEESYSKTLEDTKRKIRLIFPKGNTKFDKYIKWITREANRINKTMIKWYKTNRFESLDDLIEQGFLTRGEITGQLYIPPNLQDGSSIDLKNRFASIIAWVEGEGENLYDYSLKEALKASEGFVIMPEGGVEQGEVVYSFDDGWTIQELRTDKQLDNEGTVMQHCVGSYCEAFIDDEYNIYSLRDPNGNPHVTLERVKKRRMFEEIKGKQNDVPVKKYRKYIFEWLTSEWFIPSNEALEDEYVLDSGRESEFVTGFLGMFGVEVDQDYVSKETAERLRKSYLLLIDAIEKGYYKEEDANLYICDYGPTEGARLFACTKRRLMGELFHEIMKHLNDDERGEIASYLKKLNRKQRDWILG